MTNNINNLQQNLNWAKCPKLLDLAGFAAYCDNWHDDSRQRAGAGKIQMIHNVYKWLKSRREEG
jgi:hypothetical protein